MNVSYWEELKSMRWSMAIVIVLFIVGVPLLLLLWFINTNWMFEPFHDFEYVESFVLENSNELERQANNYRGGKEEPKEGLQYSPYTVDANGNVYFCVNSNLFATMGFLHRKEDAELPDSGGEPYFKETRHIIGNWWYYISD